MASCNTQVPIGTMRPVSSASSMNSLGVVLRTFVVVYEASEAHVDNKADTERRKDEDHLVSALASSTCVGVKGVQQRWREQRQAQERQPCRVDPAKRQWHWINEFAFLAVAECNRNEEVRNGVAGIEHSEEQFIVARVRGDRIRKVDDKQYHQAKCHHEGRRCPAARRECD